MIKTSFKKLPGDPEVGTSLYWELTLEADAHGVVSDRFVPELAYDFFYIKEGAVRVVDSSLGEQLPLGPQSLKTIHTQPLTLSLVPPLVLYGVRLPLQFAESYWGQELPANRFLDQDWVAAGTDGLDSFARQVSRTLRERRASRAGGPMLTPTLQETQWLSHYSPRHRRRLFKGVFGISQKELRAIQGLHAFLGQACDFASGRPRIIEHIDAEVFYDQPHFNRLFRKLTDLSPLEYLMDTSILQDNLMAASYNEPTGQPDTMEP